MKSIELHDFDGEPQTIRIGDSVEFKDDIEQVGTVKDIDLRRRTLLIETEDEYGQGRITERGAGAFCLNTWS